MLFNILISAIIIIEINAFGPVFVEERTFKGNENKFYIKKYE